MRLFLMATMILASGLTSMNAREAGGAAVGGGVREGQGGINTPNYIPNRPFNQMEGNYPYYPNYYYPNYYPNYYPYNPSYYPDYDQYNSPSYNQQPGDAQEASFPYHPV